MSALYLSYILCCGLGSFCLFGKSTQQSMLALQDPQDQQRLYHIMMVEMYTLFHMFLSRISFQALDEFSETHEDENTILAFQWLFMALFVISLQVYKIKQDQ